MITVNDNYHNVESKEPELLNNKNENPINIELQNKNNVDLVENLNEEKKSNPKFDEKYALELIWNVSLTTMVKDEKSDKKGAMIERKILDEVSGSIQTGQSLAILGASGAGKTTLLNHLSRKIESSTLKSEGAITLNGSEISNDDFSAISSYVMQDDTLEPCMSPREILLFTARLRLKMDRKNLEERVKYLLKILRIEKCQNTKIGSDLERGVSGGERKRTSIAVELLSDSSIIFLDEPTTGLDSYNAFEVIKTLNELCNENKMIIFTIHQPASELYSLLSKICILALGKTVYFGDSKYIYDYFAAAKLPIPLNYNPFEHFIEVTNISIVDEEYVKSAYPDIEKIENQMDKYKYLVGKMNEKYISDFKHVPENKYQKLTSEMKELIEEKKVYHSIIYQIWNLILRTTIIAVRNKKVLFAKVSQSVVIGVIIALVFNNLLRDKIGIDDRRGLLIIVAILCVFSATNSAILVCNFLI